MVVKLKRGKILHRLVKKLTQYGVTFFTLWWGYVRGKILHRLVSKLTQYCVLLTLTCAKF